MSSRLSFRETFLVWDDEYSLIHEVWMSIDGIWIMRTIPFSGVDETVRYINDKDPFILDLDFLR